LNLTGVGRSEARDARFACSFASALDGDKPLDKSTLLGHQDPEASRERTTRPTFSCRPTQTP
jgi:hypothetical protein